MIGSSLFAYINMDVDLVEESILSRIGTPPGDQAGIVYQGGITSRSRRHFKHQSQDNHSLCQFSPAVSIEDINKLP